MEREAHLLQVNSMVANLICDQAEMMTHFDGRLDRHSGSLAHHRTDLDGDKKEFLHLINNFKEVVDECEFLKGTIQEMQGKLCHCGSESPHWKGKGTEENPLEYTKGSDHSYHTPPLENSSPVPVAELLLLADQSLLSLDAKNTAPCARTPLALNVCQSHSTPLAPNVR